jgi:hypothetical protein
MEKWFCQFWLVIQSVLRVHLSLMDVKCSNSCKSFICTFGIPFLLQFLRSILREGLHDNLANYCAGVINREIGGSIPAIYFL